MNTIRFLTTAIFASLLVLSMGANAEDIDIYSGTVSNGAPNVMFIIDNASNSNASMSACTYWDGASPTGSNTGNKSLDNYMCALDGIVHNMATNSDNSAAINVGITTQAGVYLELTPVDDYAYTGSYTHTAGDTNREVISAAIRAITDVSGNANQGASFQETWAYYTGGNGGTTNVGENSGTTYAGTTATTGCQKNYNIFISGVTPSAHSSTASSLTNLTDAATNAVSAGVITSAQKTELLTQVTTNLGSEKPYGIEWARFGKTVDTNTTSSGTGVQSIITYSVAAGSPVYPSTMDTWEQYIYDTAAYGGGKYFAATSYDSIYQSILKILNEVQAVNSVFSSSSLPVSVNAQGTYLNQIYMGMFRPDENGYPRWVGNLKQYHFTATRDSVSHLITLSLADSQDASAINSSTGFISPNATSYWTCGGDPSGSLVITCSPVSDVSGGFWANDSNKDSSVGTHYDLPDGEWVDKGGAAQVSRLANLTADYTTTPGTSTNPRKLYTYCPSGSSCVASLTDTSNVFDTSNAAITDAMLGTGSITISSITSASTVQSSGITPGSGGTPSTISITAVSKSGNTVTASVSAADLAKLSAGTQLNISTGSTKYDCNPCSVTSVDSVANTFDYTNSGGHGSATLPSTATIYSNYVTVDSTSHGLAVGDTVTISACTTHTALNSQVATITATATDTFTLATGVTLATTGTDTACKYTPNLATVTTATSHGLPSDAQVDIAGATPADYDGTWTITVTGATTFTYQYTVAAPLASAGSGATVTSSSTTRDDLMKWVRGDDNYGDEASLCPPGTSAGSGNCPNPAVTVRPSLHGDVLHSRPVTINYGSPSISILGTTDSGGTRTATASTSDVAILSASGSSPGVKFANGESCNVTVASTTTFTYSTTSCGAAGAQTATATSFSDVVVFYGANDGVFRAINGNQSITYDSVEPGGEFWGFIPSEFFSSFKRQHDNSPILDLPSTVAGILPTPQTKDYFADGSTGVYQKLNSDGSTNAAYLYISMRRGGRLIYALDVTNPVSPSYLWKITNSGDFTELGYTFSAPKVALIKGYTDGSGNAKPVVIFGAGYATTQDTEPAGTDAMGRGIYIVDAATGDLVWRATYGASSACVTGASSTACTVAGMDYSIAADITLYDTDSDGYIDRLYAVDTGGNVWRVDTQRTASTTAPQYWRVNQVASLGSDTSPGRKFFYGLDIVPTTSYDALVLGSGDREHPLESNSSYNTQDRIYMLQDLKGDDGSSLTTITNTDLFNATSTAYDSAAASYDGSISPNKGYFINLATGEKVVNAPLTVAGYTYLGTNQPTASATCTENLGIARGYKIDPLSGTYTSTEYAGGGLPPSPVAGVVSVTPQGESESVLVPFIIGGGGDSSCSGADCSSALGGAKPTITVPTTRTRTYWYMENK